MKNISKTILVIAASVMSLTAATAEELKIASVSMQKLFNEYHMTKKVQEQVRVDQERIQKDNAKRLEHIRALQEEIEKLGKKRSDATISDKKRLEIEREIKLKLSEGNAADSERRQWLQRQSKALGEQTSEEQRIILEKIQKYVDDYAREQDLDIIVDNTASSATRTPVFAFMKDKYDVTDVLLKELNVDAPAEEAAPAEASE
ncbi:OmpH family outer membrane protein [Rubritalea marina]|uniref:OmpH family outer membrane protein n=1 Tax=Rubritalea marina TaxID=361055 RepID=UPI00037063AE|nr:OmpH family outer membrane protein [Rubritalea marina]